MKKIHNKLDIRNRRNIEININHTSVDGLFMEGLEFGK